MDNSETWKKVRESLHQLAREAVEDSGELVTQHYRDEITLHNLMETLIASRNLRVEECIARIHAINDEAVAALEARLNARLDTATTFAGDLTEILQ